MDEVKPKYKIAAVVVTYNSLTLLQECVNSLKNQNKLNFLFFLRSKKSQSIHTV
jgi:GT2 family glycosyltransferase